MSSEKKLYYKIQMEMIFESMYFNEILIGFLSKGKIFRVVKLSYLIWVDGEAIIINSLLIATNFVPKAVIFGYSFSFQKKCNKLFT